MFLFASVGFFQGSDLSFLYSKKEVIMIKENQRAYSSALLQSEDDIRNVLEYVEIGEIELEASSTHFELADNASYSRIAALHAVADNINYELAKYISSKTNIDVIVQSYSVHSGSIKWIAKVFGKPRIDGDTNSDEFNKANRPVPSAYLVNAAAVMGIISGSWVIGPDVVEWVNTRLHEETQITKCIPNFKNATYVTPLEGQGIMALIDESCDNPYQVAYALYNHNKEHFIDSNIDMVMAGVQLKIPPDEDISKVSEADAQSFIRQSTYTQGNSFKDHIRKFPDA